MQYIKIIFISLMMTLFLGCDTDNTEEPIVTDIGSLSIDNQDIQIYSTDAPINISASVSLLDGNTEEANFATWSNSDYDLIYIYGNTLWATSNGGEATLGVEFEQFNDSADVKVYELTSFFISSEDITTTGDFVLEAKGNFEDGETNRTIVKNIVWSADNDAEITVEDDVSTITIYSGDTNVTATVFYETNTSSPIAPVSKVYSIE